MGEVLSTSSAHKGRTLRSVEDGVIKDRRSAGKRPAGSYLIKIYGYESLQALFKFSGAQATRRIPRVLQPFREEYLFYFKFAVNDGTDSRSQLELETSSSESSPLSQSESSARHPPDSAASTTSEIFITPPLPPLPSPTPADRPRPPHATGSGIRRLGLVPAGNRSGIRRSAAEHAPQGSAGGHGEKSRHQHLEFPRV
jgi:hypothetical protein